MIRWIKHNLKKSFIAVIILIEITFLLWYVKNIYCDASKIVDSEKEIISSFNNIASAFLIWIKNNLHWILLTVAPAIATLIGMSLSSLFKFISKSVDWKNRKAFQTVILKKTTDERIKNLVWTYLVFYVEMFWIISSLFIIIGFIEIFKLFAQIRFSKMGAPIRVVPIIILLVSIIISYLIGKFKYTKLLGSVYPIFFVSIESILVILQVTFIANNEKSILTVLSITTILFIISIIFVLYTLGFYRKYKDLPIIVSMITRHIFLYGCIFHYCITVTMINVGLIFVIWVITSSFEYFYILYKDEENLVEISICLTDGSCKKAKDKVVQYAGNKLKYTLLDGTEEIVNDSYIRQIEFNRNITFFERLICKINSKKKTYCYIASKETCKDGKNDADNENYVEYQDYHIISDNWIYFYRINDKVKEVKIVQSSDVVKIIFKKDMKSVMEI